MSDSGAGLSNEVDAQTVERGSGGPGYDAGRAAGDEVADAFHDIVADDRVGVVSDLERGRDIAKHGGQRRVGGGDEEEEVAAER